MTSSRYPWFRTAIAVTAIVVALVTTVWQRIDADRLKNRYECLADYTQRNNRVTVIRVRLANEDRAALENLVDKLLKGLDAKRALVEYQATTKHNDEARAAHPLESVADCPPMNWTVALRIVDIAMSSVVAVLMVVRIWKHRSFWNSQERDGIQALAMYALGSTVGITQGLIRGSQFNIGLSFLGVAGLLGIKAVWRRPDRAAGGK